MTCRAGVHVDGPPAATALMSIADSLINPLAARRAPDVNH
jgi:hypothetical protein